MHAFGLGYGTALAASLVGGMAWSNRGQPHPNGPVAEWSACAGLFVLVVFCGWVLVRGSLSSVRGYDVRAAFREADARGRKSFAAGFLSGLGATGGAVLAHAVLRPSGQERDLNTIRAGVLSFLSVGLGWLLGVTLYLWLCRPRAGVGP